jgi:hypothetical protein
LAKNTQLTNLAVNTEADALAAQANSGILRIYDGTQPATGDTAITTQNLLAELTMNATAFGASVAGVITANAITADSSADATGTATWFRLFKSDGTTALWDGSVGTSDANIILNSVSISAGAAVSVSSFTHTIAKSTSGS